MCECNCDCEIDTSKPEEYEVKNQGQWRQVVSLSDTGYGEFNNPVRYAVVYKTPVTTNGFGQKWASADLIRRKPQWRPEVGKWYFFSDDKINVNTALGTLGRLIKIGASGYIGAVRSGTNMHWEYCWPAGDLIELGE